MPVVTRRDGAFAFPSRSRAGALRADVGVAKKCPILLQELFEAPIG
jgi:hypothetical protein